MAHYLEAIRRPRHAMSVFWWLTRGWIAKLMLPLLGHRFSAGRNFRLAGRLKVRGPGTVRIGDDVLMDGLVTPFTHAHAAEIVIGDRVFLNGTKFGCADRITVGEDSMIAQATIMDTNFHSLAPDRRSRTAVVPTNPVTISENVWITGQVGILPGTSIGRNSVVSFGSVCGGTFPADMLIVGNPARPVRRIDE